ncbi:transcriptional repressor LexA [Flagellatimonas centrodinii]|uniref:transcriptional repressor LexA n=1 Tax=Flagellatimonas centrodinii TaxID=2806210 RepID=UPI001FED37AF|nr:transcriptional repressor LexA [Flagellatimonas centrodinii]ULQ45993.1 transcriptional repressor LexA [Flagellatimonas centrodinii]
MVPLTDRQRDILDFIRETLRDRGAPPTRADIMRRFGFRSPTAADDHLKALARKGAIELLPNAARGIRLLADEPPAEAGLAIVGRVAAGQPIMSDAGIERWIPIEPRFFSPRAHFLLRVHGDSMRDAGIFDGDLLAVHRTPVADSGQIVVARVDDEITVKRLRLRDEFAELLPANPAYAPIRVNLSRQELVIEGRAVGLIRSGDMARNL